MSENLTPLTEAELASLLSEFAGVPSDYVGFLKSNGWGKLSSGVMLYSGPVEPEGIFSVRGSQIPKGIVLIGDDFSGTSFGFDAAAGWTVVSIDSLELRIQEESKTFADFLQIYHRDIPDMDGAPVREYFALHLPEFRLVAELQSGLVFRCPHPSGIYRSSAVDIYPESQALAVHLAATYDPSWRGGMAYPLGRDSDLARLKFGAEESEEEERWIVGELTPQGWQETLAQLHGDFLRLAPRFFEDAEQQLLSNKLLQVALAAARRISLGERDGLEAALDAAGNNVAKLEHPAFLKVRDEIRAAWTVDVSREERRQTSQLAYECLVLK